MEKNHRDVIYKDRSMKFGPLVQPTSKHYMALKLPLISAAYREFLIYILLLVKIFVPLLLKFEV